MGPFTQEDPIGIAGGLNLYGYANGDPINFSDPFGLAACCSLALRSATWGARLGGFAGLPGVIVGGITGGVVGGVAGLAIGHLLNDAEAGRSLDEPGSLEGATPEEIGELIPGDWESSPSARGGGTRYSNPNARGEQVRVQPGNANDPNPVKQGPYVRVSKNGVRSDPIPLRDNPTLPRGGRE